jgi:hypothetical protein
MGVGEKFHPLPWSGLDYEKGRNGYVVSYTKDQLKGAPADGIDQLTTGNGTGLRDQVYEYYDAPRYWM